MKHLSKGDVIRFEDAGIARLGFGKGNPSEEHVVHEGEIMLLERPTSVEGVFVDVGRMAPRRTVLKAAPRPQKLRYPSETILTFDLPTGIDPEVQRLDNLLQERGAALKTRLRQEAERLKK